MSTGPKTEEGKNHSRLNALKHGLLASTVLIAKGRTEESAQFAELLAALDQDLQPVGRLEEMMVEKIAVCWWRQKRALDMDVELVPANQYMDQVLRYETSAQRQLAHAINQLERLQRARKGEHVPAPVTLQVSTDHSALRTNKVKVRHFRVRYNHQVPFDLAKCGQSLAWRLILRS